MPGGRFAVGSGDRRGVSRERESERRDGTAAAGAFRQSEIRPEIRRSRGWRRRSTGAALAAAPPPVVHEIVDDLTQLPDGPAFSDEVARRSVERHDAVADAPAPLTLRVQPDDPLHPLADEPQRPRLRVVVVVAGVAQHEDRRLPVQRLQLGLREPAEGEPEVRPAVVVHRGTLERPLDGALDRVGAEGLSDLGDLGDEHVRANPAEALLEAPDELQHEAGGVADRVRHVADRDEPRLLAVAADPGQLAGIEATRLEGLHDPLEIALDGGPVEAIRDPP